MLGLLNHCPLHSGRVHEALNLVCEGEAWQRSFALCWGENKICYGEVWLKSKAEGKMAAVYNPSYRSCFSYGIVRLMNLM